MTKGRKEEEGWKEEKKKGSKGEETQVTNRKNEHQYISPTCIKVIRGCQKQLFANKFDNWDEINKLLKKKLLKLKVMGTKISSLIFSKEIEPIVKYLPHTKNKNCCFCCYKTQKTSSYNFTNEYFRIFPSI